MSIFSGSRRIAGFAAAILAAFSLFIAPVNHSFAQPAAAPAAASGKSETEMLIGPYVSGADSGQYKDVTDAITRFKNGKLDEARDLLTQAVKNDNKLPPAEVMLARMILSVGQAGPGRAELERSVKAYPKDPEAYLMFAELAIQDGRITDADAILAKAQPLIAAFDDSNNQKRKNFLSSHLYADLANVDVARTDWDSAVDHAKEWLKTDPDSVQAHQLLARALFKQGLDRDAFAELTAASKVDPKAVNPYIYMALLHEESTKSDKHDRAAKMIKAAIDEKPKDLTTLLQAANWALSTSTNSNNGLKDAQSYADKALEIDPKSNDAKMMRAIIARLNGDLPLAEKLLQQIVQDAPSNVAASNQLALVLVETGDKDKINKALQIAEVNMQLTAKGNQFSPEVASTYAWVLYKNDKKKEAGEVLTKVLQSTRQASPDMAYYLGRMLQDAGQFDQAAQILKAAADNPSPFAKRQDTIALLAEVQKQAKEKAPDSDKGADKK